MKLWKIDQTRRFGFQVIDGLGEKKKASTMVLRARGVLRSVSDLDIKSPKAGHQDNQYHSGSLNSQPNALGADQMHMRSPFGKTAVGLVGNTPKAVDRAGAVDMDCSCNGKYSLYGMNDSQSQ